MKSPSASKSRRLLWLRIFGGNFAYSVPNRLGWETHHSGWRPSLFRLTLKFFREGWGRDYGNGQHRYTWKEFCWRLPHE